MAESLQVLPVSRSGVRCSRGRLFGSAAFACFRAATTLALTISGLTTPATAASLELSGRVVDSSGAPIASASVALQKVLPFHQRSLRVLDGEVTWEAAVSVQTSKDGGYRLAVPEAGMWRVEISAENKVPVRLRLTPLLESELLPDAALESDAGLEVRVEDGAGEPIAGAQVWTRPDEERARRSRRSRSSPWSPGGGYGLTGEDGTVRLARMADQRLSVHAFARGFLGASSSEVATAAATITLERGRPVTVRVRTSTGEPASEAVLTASSLNWVAGVTDENGEARLSVAPGEPLRVIAWRSTGQVEATEVLVSADVSSSSEAADVVRDWRLPPGVILDGKVIDADTRAALGGALVWSPNDSGGVRRTEPDGRYELAAGSGSRWALQAGASGYGVARTEALARPDGLRVPTLALPPALSLEGRVVDPGGEGIGDALLTATARNQMVMARTDAEGRFRLAGLSVGKPYELAAEARGFASESRKVTPERGTELDIVLRPGRELVGRLVSTGGEPVVGGRVYLVAVETDPRAFTGASRNERPLQAESDGEGRFRLTDLPQQLMALVAVAEGFAEKALNDVDLTTGEGSRDLGDVVLSLGVELRGVVRSRDGEPVPEAKLAIFPGGFSPSVMRVRMEERLENPTVTDTRGRFVIAGLSGNVQYNLSVSHDEHVRRMVPNVDPGAEEPLEIMLERAARVSGRVLDAAGAPVENVSVLVLTVTPAEPSTQMWGQQTEARGFTDAEGKFEVDSIGPGRLEVSVAPGAGWISREPLAFTLRGGEERGGLVLRVTGGSELTGTVTDPKGLPVVGATVGVERYASGSTLDLIRHRRSASLSERTDGDGRFLITGIDPSLQTARVSVQHPAFMALERDVELQAGANRVDLVLSDGAVVSGRVVTDTGEPVEGARIEVQPSGIPSFRFVSGQEAGADSGSDGSFEIRGLETGVHRLVARKSGFAQSEGQEVEASVGSGGSVTLTLHRGGTIRGRILGVKTEDLAGVQVTASDRAQSLAMGLVGDDGEYRIPNVGFSSGQVMAMRAGGARFVTEEFNLDTRDGEVWIDLEFEDETGHGSSLSGFVLMNGKPMAHAQVVASGGESNVGSAATDSEGRFRIGGLKDGHFQVMVMAIGASRHSETVEVRGDTQVSLELSTIKVSGRVIGERAREPVVGASLTATVAGDPMQAFGGPEARTTVGGDFEISVPGGGTQVVLRARAPGYGEGTLEVDTSSGVDVAGVLVELPEGAGLELDVALWTGGRPGFLSVALMDPAGNQVLADTLMGRSQGAFRLDSAPLGEWTLLVASEHSAVVEREVTVPGPPVELMLPQGATVSVEISGVAGGPGAAKVRLVSPAGAIMRFPIFGQVLSEMPVFGSRSQFPFVPAGDWVVELVDASGAVHRKPVTTMAGETARVVFE